MSEKCLLLQLRLRKAVAVELAITEVMWLLWEGSISRSDAFFQYAVSSN